MRERINRWKQAFDTDANAINKALSKMAWDLAAFSCLVEVVRQAPDTDGNGGKRLNGLVLDLVASGFWSTTLQGVRRLTECAALNGPQGVCSLGSLIQDAKAARSQLTRRVFVEDIAGLSYNYERTRDRFWAFVRTKPAGPAWVPPELRYESSEQRHSAFDWLSGTTPSASTPDDLIRPEVFDSLEHLLARLGNVVEHVNVQIAHAATEASRAGRVLEHWGLSDAKAALKDLAQIAEITGEWFCYSGIGSVLPTPQFDQFAHLEQPLFTGDVKNLREIWDAFNEEAGQWHSVDHRDLLGL